MVKKVLKKLWRGTLLIGGVSIILLPLPGIIMGIMAVPKKYSVEDVPATRVVIVFGAGLLRDGSAGPVLSDRMQTAVSLYQSGKADKILISGE